MNINESIGVGTSLVVTLTALVAAFGTLAAKLRTAWTEIGSLRETVRAQEDRGRATDKQVEKQGEQLVAS